MIVDAAIIIDNKIELPLVESSKVCYTHTQNGKGEVMPSELQNITRGRSEICASKKKIERATYGMQNTRTPAMVPSKIAEKK